MAGGNGGNFILQEQEKEYFLKLLERFASGFFVKVHAFAIMSNHFYILATGMELKAKKASKQELLRRYKLLYPKESEPPPGRYEPNGEIIWDEDGGVERLRERLGSISRFVQELKQGLAIGSYRFIANFQKQCQRKFIRPRSFLLGNGNCNVLYSTRVLRQ